MLTLISGVRINMCVAYVAGEIAEKKLESDTRLDGLPCEGKEEGTKQ